MHVASLILLLLMTNICVHTSVHMCVHMYIICVAIRGQLWLTQFSLSTIWVLKLNLGCQVSFKPS